nr:transporter substrate-binding domain-containing protein [Vibrio sinus]
MSIAKVYIFTPHGSDSITDLAQLVGKKVGARAGFPYGKKVDDSGVKLILTKSMEQNIKKLQSGRLDAIIDYTPDMYTAFDEMGIQPLSFDKDNPVEVHNDSVICKKTPETEAFIRNLNAVIN